MGPCDLRHIFSALNCEKSDKLLVGYESSDDAAIYALSDTEALVLTADFITPVVDDPYLFGQIAAANSLSDVFAMGGSVKAALNLVCFDREHFGLDVLQEILRGGEDKVREAGGVIAGGHTIDDSEMKYGLSVTGMVKNSQILRNNRAAISNALILTKPLGMGIITTAIKAALTDSTLAQKAGSIMAQLNKSASELALEFGASACTDVTGFGFLGHLHEMLNDGISFEIDSSSVPFLKEALEFEEMGIVPAGSYRNRDFLKEIVQIKNSSINEMILFDAQTSGGLLIAVSEKKAHELKKRLVDAGCEYAEIVGSVTKRSEGKIIVL